MVLAHLWEGEGKGEGKGAARIQVSMLSAFSLFYFNTGTGDKKLVPWQEAREKISKQSERLTLGLPCSTHQPLLKRKRCGQSLDLIFHSSFHFPSSRL